MIENKATNAVSSTLAITGEVASAIGSLFNTPNSDVDNDESGHQNQIKDEFKRKKRRGVKF